MEDDGRLWQRRTMANLKRRILSKLKKHFLCFGIWVLYNLSSLLSAAFHGNMAPSARSKSAPLPNRTEFPAFPFKPYSIQLQLMTALYSALQKGGVAIVESPTGTGKTLSLICSTLQWLEDRRSWPAAKEMDKNERKDAAEEDTEPDWMRDFNSSNSEHKLPSRKLPQESVNVKRKPAKNGTPFSAKSLEPAKNENADENDEAFLLDEYDSNDDSSSSVGLRKRKCSAQWSSSSSSSSNDERRESNEEGEEQRQKVFFCSRTHSQLSQFVKEFQRTTFLTSLRAISLGSRKSLCNNPDVLKLRHPARINERCLELQRNKKNGQPSTKVMKIGMRRSKRRSSGCPMMKSHKLQRQFKQEVWQSSSLDIEDLIQLGSRLGTCPYYGSRRMLPSADLVVLPYQSLLHKLTRESLGLNLEGSIVIIDEAHNLVDSVTNMHSCCVSASQLREVSSQLSDYLEKFRSRLGAGNRRYIQTLLILVQAFLKSLLNADNTASDVRSVTCVKSIADEVNTKIMTINDFLFSLNVDNINMLKLWKFIKESNIVHKVSSYGEKLLHEQIMLEPSALEAGTSQSGFHALAELVLALMNADSDGRILVVPSSTCGKEGGGYLKFVMLNAANVFKEVVDKAHAVVLAGGTLQPIEELWSRLFPHLQDDSVHIFSCGHIVPPESVLPMAISHGPAGRSLDFTYQSRSSPSMIEELGRLLCNISSVVPEGIVVFFPSFEYENQVYATWKSSGILAKLEMRKYVFQEPRAAGDVEVTLEHYKKKILQVSLTGADMETAKRNGAIMLCVVGGKMSEGINFSDGMGRCVVMVGLPYPSPSDPELIERIRYIDQLHKEEVIQPVARKGIERNLGVHILQNCGPKARQYYENLCMKAVNQSIGRAIRHIDDYAAILLVDLRYNSMASIQSGPTSKLPSWIKDQLVNVTGNFGEVHRRLHHFFKHNQKQNQLSVSAQGLLEGHL